MGRSTRTRQPGERRYPHVERAANAVKQQHNAWVLEAAVRNGGEVVALDGVDLNTCGILVRGGVAAAWHSRGSLTRRVDSLTIMKTAAPQRGPAKTPSPRKNKDAA